MFPEAAREVRRRRSPTPTRRRRTSSSSSRSTSCRWRPARYVSEAYQSFIGFEVAKPVLERAFHDDLRPRDEGRASSTRIWRSARTGTRSARLIPEITRIAWRDKREEIVKALPGRRAARRSSSTCSRQEYERDLRHRRTSKPGLFARFLAFLYKLLPKIGPLQAAAVQGADAGGRGAVSRELQATRASATARRSRPSARGRLDLANTDFDTGKPSAHGEYALADETYAELLDRLARAQVRRRPRRLAPQHRRVLRGGAGPHGEPEGAQAARADPARARCARGHEGTKDTKVTRTQSVALERQRSAVADSRSPVSRRRFSVSYTRRRAAAPPASPSRARSPRRASR